jgi:hypothetical protein
MRDRGPFEQAALDYCAPRGIRLSEFMQLWTYEDQMAALEWQAEQARRCNECGQNLDETMGPDTDDTWNAEVSGHCDGCRALHRAAAIEAGRDDLDPTVGARYRMWKDSEGSNGRVHESGPAVSEA